MSITMIGLDTAKSVFQVHGVNESGKMEFKRKLRRSELIPFFEKLEACTVIMEASGAAHHWARILRGLGHKVKLIAPAAVRPFVKKGMKNDPADASALCTAASRPDMIFVPIKNIEQQGILALHSARLLLVKQETMLANATRPGDGIWPDGAGPINTAQPALPSSHHPLLLLGNGRIATLIIITSQACSSACRIATLRVVYGAILPASIRRA
jgi:hypothetical protein